MKEISTDQELKDAIDEAGGLIQSIQDYVGRDFTKDAKLRFPRGYLRTASEQRSHLSFLDDQQLRKDLSYTLILFDVLHWITVRTDLGGQANNMVIKLGIFLLGQLVESITKVYLKGTCGKAYKPRNEYLVKEKIITEGLREDLDWIWDIRNGMHLFLLEKSDYDTKYKTKDWNRAVRSFHSLLKALELHKQTANPEVINSAQPE